MHAVRMPVRGIAVPMVAGRSAGAIVVSSNVSRLLKGARADAMAKFRELVGELRLTSAFPELGDAFDAEELPIWFILRRDSRSGRAGTAKPGEHTAIIPTRAASRLVKKGVTARKDG
jgi:hypothetical protein